MQLSELDSDLFNITICRDGEFFTLGSFTQNQTHQLVFIDEQKFIPYLSQYPKYSCVITRVKFISEIPQTFGLAISKNPKISFYQIHNYLLKKNRILW